MGNEDNTKVIVSALAGVAAGFFLGMFLWSPDKKEFREDMLQKFDEGKDKLNDLMERKEDLIRMKDKVLSMVKDVEQKIDDVT